MKLRPKGLSVVLLCLGLICAPNSPDRPACLTKANRPGIVVEQVGRGSALERAGILPGDLLLSWERPPDPPANPKGGKGEIRTVFDWLWVKAEQAPRGTVRLHGERNGTRTLFEVQKGVWDARARPRMKADLLLIYTEGRHRIEAGDFEEGIGLWNQLTQRVGPQAAPGLRPWLLLQVGEAMWKNGQGEKARAFLHAALADARDAQTQVAVWEALGENYQSTNEMTLAESSFHAALEAGETTWGESLQVASTITKLGDTLRLQSRLDAAKQLHNHALEIRQRWAPDGLEVTNSLHHLFLVAWDQRDLESMSVQAKRALIIQERWPSDSLAMADTLDDVARLAFDRARYDEATKALQRAASILEQRSPGSLALASSLTRLAWMAREFGDTEAAADLHQRALEIRKRLAPGSLGTASLLNSLGLIAIERGDLTTAAALVREALEIRRKAAPKGPGVAVLLDLLGTISRLQGDLDHAWNLHHRALEIFERFAPDGREVATFLSHAGMVAEARGDLSLAIDLLQRAQAIYEHRAPGSVGEVLVLTQLGRLYRRTRRLDQAAQIFSQAVAVLESQMGRLKGFQEFQATFRERYEEVYDDAIEVELGREHTAEAFHLVERSRARRFLTLLSERDLTFSGELPDLLERSQRENAAQYDQALRKLAAWTTVVGEDAKAALHRELNRLRRERDEIATEIRKASPRLAALRQPQPLDLSSARKILDPGTLALSYSVGQGQTALFALTREGGLRTEILPFGKERLRRDVKQFLKQIQRKQSLVSLGRPLYSALIEPVADLVEQSERVLILPDGPLHRLPFGALLRDTGDSNQYLIEWKPFHTALSLTVYKTLRATARATPRVTAVDKQIVAFGDPRYLRNPIRPAFGVNLRNFNWRALPYSRREVERIAEVFPGARLYLDQDATEERAKTATRNAHILHFATHGYIDDRIPLDSALVLTIPEEFPAGRDNGLLQVWEIFESVRLDADLVVLSACDSALGQELSGEGLIGLTRAFQYAGARSVVASMWSVADQATAELMARFYRHLASGLSKDEALRAAQIELIREPIRTTTERGETVERDDSAPFFWAGFQLFGDWR